MTDTKQADAGASVASTEIKQPLSYEEEFAERDVDRGTLVGAVLGLAMFFTFQAMIVGFFQSGVISGETELLAPLRFAGITQGFYVVPTLLFFVNRKCPKMAKGFLIVAGAVFALSLVALIAG